MKEQLYKKLFTQLFIIEIVLLFICLIKEHYNMFFILAIIVLLLMLFIYAGYFYFNKK